MCLKFGSIFSPTGRILVLEFRINPGWHYVTYFKMLVFYRALTFLLPNSADFLITPFGNVQQGHGSLNSPKHFLHCIIKD